jgi:hypothetical protein
VRDSLEIAAQFVVSPDAVLEPPQDGHLPLPSEDVQRQFDRVLVSLPFEVKLRHEDALLPVSISPIGAY